MTHSHSSFTAIVLAGSRAAHDPVAEATGVPCKAFTPVGNTPMVFRVLETLQTAETVSRRILCGPSWSIISQSPELHARIDEKDIEWIEPQATPSTSAAFAMQSISHETPILLTTADHALLTPEMVNYFCAKAQESQSDVIAGLVPYDIVKQAFPESKRTVMKFKDQGYCGCNLFAFLTPQGRTMAKFWQQIEQERKKPLRLIGILGWMAVFRFLTGNLSLAQGLEGLSKKLNLRIHTVTLPFPEAAVDVDTVADWELVQKIVRERSTNT
ncbi:nucleotidyltransferase family protein [Nitrospira sp. M1]